MKKYVLASQMMQEKKFKTHKVLFITIPHLKLHFVEAQKEEKMLKQASFFKT